MREIKPTYKEDIGRRHFALKFEIRLTQIRALALKVEPTWGERTALLLLLLDVWAGTILQKAALPPPTGPTGFNIITLLLFFILTFYLTRELFENNSLFRGSPRGGGRRPGSRWGFQVPCSRAGRCTTTAPVHIIAHMYTMYNIYTISNPRRDLNRPNSSTSQPRMPNIISLFQWHSSVTFTFCIHL